MQTATNVISTSSPVHEEKLKKKKKKIPRMSFLLVLDIKSMLKKYKVERLYKMNGHVK